MTEQAQTTQNETTGSGTIEASYGPNLVRWTLNAEVYAPRDIIYQAAYVFIDRAYLWLDLDETGAVLVTLRGKTPLGPDELLALSGEFANELLHQRLRWQLAEQNKRLRELIVAKALFAAARPKEMAELQDKLLEAAETPVARPWADSSKEERDELDALLNEIEREFADDPASIAVPWDESAKKDAPPVSEPKSE